MSKLCLVRSILMGLSLSLLLVWGCASSPPARFYTLSPMSGGAALQEVVQPIGAGISIGIGPIRIPDYLDRPGIVTRPGDGHTIAVAEFDLWAGSFKEALINTLAQNLSLLLHTNQVLIYPMLGVVKLDYRLYLVVERFEGTLGGEVNLVARWVVYEGPAEGSDKKAGVVQRSRIVEAVTGSDYPALVAAHNRAVERLSREIARGLQSLPAPVAAK